MAALWCLPMLVTVPWAFSAIFGFSRLVLADVDPELVRRRRDNCFRALGFFEISVGLTLVGFDVTHVEASAWTSAPALFVLGAGFVVGSWWHPLERLGVNGR